MTRHLFNIVRKKHGNDTGAARELGISVNAFVIRKRMIGVFDTAPQEPMADVEILVDMLREYLDMVVPDQRVVIMNKLMDGYCVECGSSAPCHC